MERNFPERDWQVFRQVREEALERFCEKILSEINSIAKDTSMSSHKRYQLIYEHIHDRDEKIAAAFNDPSRSNARIQLLVMKNQGMISSDDLARFSLQTGEFLQQAGEIF